MSEDEIKLEETGHGFNLLPEEGAIIFTKNNGVEIMFPNVFMGDEQLPEHLVPMMALAFILGDEKRYNDAVDNMFVCTLNHKKESE